MHEEERRLLAPEEAEIEIQSVFNNNDAIFERFSVQTKRKILFMVSWCGFVALVSMGCFVPLMPQITEDLGSTEAAISLSISIAVFASSVGSLIAGFYSTRYGRRPVYLVTLSLLCIGSIGFAVSNSVPELTFWRFVQNFGAYPSIPLGPSVIGDIYKLEERGTASGIFFGATLVGPLIAPLIGGFMARYTSWRVMQWSIFLATFISLSFMLVFFPETIHPGSRGIDKVKPDVNGSIQRQKSANPLSTLWLLGNPMLLAMSFATTCTALTDFLINIPMTRTLGANYDIHNPVMLGACFMPSALAQIFAALISGHLSDILLVRLRKTRNGVWCPEDRLRIGYIMVATLVPFSLLFFGLFNQFVPGKIGLVLNLICLFLNGLGVEMVLSPCTVYVIDIMQPRGAECIAVMKSVRMAVVSVGVMGIFPLIDALGCAYAYAIVSLLGWASFGTLRYIIRHGDYLRAVSGIEVRQKGLEPRATSGHP